MQALRIVFIGCVKFSEKALHVLIDNNYLPVGVITKQQSSFNSDFVDLAAIAQAYGLPYKYVNDINHPANAEWIKNKEPDVIFCFGWSSLIKEIIFNTAPMGVIGYHPALLPNNRGRHPIIWALALGLQETGSSFFFMDTGADTGDIVSQKTIPISPVDNAMTLYDKIIEIAMSQIVELLPQLINKTYKRIPQVWGSGNSWRKRIKIDGQIDFRMAAKDIINLTRALYKPYAGAHIVMPTGDYIVWKAAYADDAPENIEPGKVLEVNGRAIRVKCGNGCIWLLEHEINDLPAEGEYL
jgi:methionyl-tRNA formyltransferase